MIINRKTSSFPANALGLLVALMLPVLAAAQSGPSAHTHASRYNANGQLTGTIAPDPDGYGSLKYLATRNTYNAQGLLVKIESGELSVWKAETIDPANWGASFTVHRTQRYTYDAWGRKLTAKTEKSGTAVMTQYTYDSVGRLLCETVRMNPAIYNSLPSTACVLGAPGSHGPDRITKYFYEGAGRVATIKKAVGTAIEQDYVKYTYGADSFEGPEYVTDANGNRAKKEYDGFGRVEKWIFPSKTSTGSLNTADYEFYTYDRNGNRKTFRKRDGRTIYYNFDALNRVSLKNVPGSADDVYYDYDNRNLQLYARFMSSGGQGITSTYDGFGRLETSRSNMGGTSRSLSYQYDLNNNRTRVTHPDNKYFTYTYDGLDRMQYVYEYANTRVATLQYNNRGRRSGLARTNGYGSTYDYDPVSRLDYISHNLYGTGNDVSYDFSFNPASQVETRATSNDAYVYADHATGIESYAVNGLNQYTSVDGKPFSYDGNGNLRSDETKTYTYDIENRLTRATSSSSGATIATLKYDPRGRLYETSGGGTTTRFLYDGDALVAEYNSSGVVTKRYVHGPGIDEPLVEYAGSSVYSGNRRNLYADHLGSITAITNSYGSVSSINQYDSYGIPDGPISGRFAYTGQIIISELGLYYYKARLYSPYIGRFLQTDPIGYADQMNLYAYVGNDPLSKVDPLGQFAQPYMYMVPKPKGMTTSEYQQAINKGTGAGLVAGASLAMPGPEDALLAGFLMTKLGQAVAKFGDDVARGAAEIFGRAQQTKKGGELTTHGSTSDRIASEMAESGEYSSVHLNQEVRTITNGDVDSKVRPDVAGVRIDNGKIDSVEVLSPGQTSQQMTDKLESALGTRCGTITCVDPD